MKRFAKICAFLTLLIFGLVPGSAIQAADDYDRGPAINDTVYYDTRDYANATSSAADCGPSDATLSGDNVHDAFVYLIGKGLKDFQVAGIIGNLQGESGPKLDPTAVNGIGATGIAQWTSGRLDALKALAQKTGKPYTNLGVQLAYLWQELNTTEKPSLAALKATTDATSAAISFQNTFERCGTPADCNQTKRVQNAQDVLSLAKSKGWTGAAPTPGAPATGCATPSGSVAGANIVKIALAEVGTNEGNTSNGGPSCKYQGSACPQEWCANFISWVFKQAGAPFTGGADGGWRIAGAAAVGEWFKTNGVWIPNPGLPIPITDARAPKPGDVLIYGGTGHANIVVSYDGKTVKTVGGNESDAVSAYTSDVFGPPLGWGRLK